MNEMDVLAEEDGAKVWQRREEVGQRGRRSDG